MTCRQKTCILQICDDLMTLAFAGRVRRVSTTVKLCEIVCDSTITYCRCVLNIVRKNKHADKIVVRLMRKIDRLT